MPDPSPAAAPSGRPSANVVAGVVLALVVVAVLAWQRPWADDGATATVPDLPADSAARAADLVAALSSATTPDQLAAAVGPGEEAARFAAAAGEARTALEVTSSSWRYLSGGEAPDRADGSTLARVVVSWTTGDDGPVPGVDVVDATVGLRLAPRDDGTLAVRGVEPLEDPVPLWLAGEVGVEGEASGPDAVGVVSLDGGVPGVDVLGLAREADDVVRATVERADGPLTVVSPASETAAAAVLGRPVDELAGIAGVATTVGGVPDGVRVVVLNPTQFDAMDARAQQVLVSHEATHLLTGAVGTSTIPPWVVEGFADYVALRLDDAPLEVSAGQALREVRAEGPPDVLPDRAAFQGAGVHGLGAVYEEAWLVFRMLGEDLPPARVVAFYEAVRDGADVDAAARRHLDADVEQITTRWRDYLEKSASTVS